MSANTENASKTQVQQLTEFLLSSLGPVIKANDIDAWQERGTLILNGEDLGLDGYKVAKWKHNAVIMIERFPHRKVNPYSLLAMVAAFLIDSGWQRDLYDLNDPELDLDAVSKDDVTVIIELELIDDIDIIPDETGPVIFNGQRYRVDMAPIDFAESVEFENGEQA